MDAAASVPAAKAREINWTVWGILGLLIVTALAIVPLTLTIIDSRESEALVIDLAGQLRGQHATVPVVMMSADPDHGLCEEALSLGANHYVVKPIDPALIVHICKQTFLLIDEK